MQMETAPSDHTFFLSFHVYYQIFIWKKKDQIHLYLRKSRLYDANKHVLRNHEGMLSPLLFRDEKKSNYIEF